MTIASQRSPCTRLNVGSIVVKNNMLISIVYNHGAPYLIHRILYMMVSCKYQWCFF